MSSAAAASVTATTSSSSKQWSSSDRNRLFDYLAQDSTAVFSVPVKLGKAALNQMLAVVDSNVDETIAVIEKLNTRGLQFDSIDALVQAMQKEITPRAEGADKQAVVVVAPEVPLLLLQQPQPYHHHQQKADLQALEAHAHAAEEAKPTPAAAAADHSSTAPNEPDMDAYRQKIRARRVERLKQSGVFSMSVTAQDRNKLFDYLALDTTLIFSEAVKLGKKELSDLLLVGATADETIQLIQTLNAANKSYPTVELLGEAMEALQQQEQQTAASNNSTSFTLQPAPKAQSPPPAPAKDHDLLFECLNDLDCAVLPDTAPLYESTIQLLLALCGHSGETAVAIINGFNAKKRKFQNTDELAQAMANEVKTNYKNIKPLRELPAAASVPPTIIKPSPQKALPIPSPSPSGSPSLSVPERTTSPTMPTPDRDMLFECLNDLDCTILPDSTPLYESTITRLLALCGNSGPTAVTVIQTLNKRKMKFKTVDELADAVVTEVKNNHPEVIPVILNTTASPPPPAASTTALPPVGTQSSAGPNTTSSATTTPSKLTSIQEKKQGEEKTNENSNTPEKPALPSAMKKPSAEKSNSHSRSSSQQFLSPKVNYHSSSSSSKSSSSHSRSPSNSPLRHTTKSPAAPVLTPLQKPVAATSVSTAAMAVSNNPRQNTTASAFSLDASNTISQSVFYQSHIHSKSPPATHAMTSSTPTVASNNIIQPIAVVTATPAVPPTITTTATQPSIQPIARVPVPKRVTFAPSLTGDESLAYCFHYLDPLSFLAASRTNKLWLLAARSRIVWSWCKDTTLRDLTSISPIAQVRLDSLHKLHGASVCFSTTSSKGLALARDVSSKTKVSASRALQEAAAKLQLVSMFTQILKLDVKCDFQSIHHETAVDPIATTTSSPKVSPMQYVSPSEKLHAILSACSNLKSLKLELLHPLRHENDSRLVQPTQIQQRPLLATFTPSLLLHLRSNLLHLDLTVQPAPSVGTITCTFSKSLVQQCESDMNHSTHIFHLLTLNLTRLVTFAWNWKMNPEATTPDAQKASANSDHGSYLQLSTLLYLKDLAVLKLSNVEFTRTAAKVIVQLSSQHALRSIYWNSNPSLQLLRTPDNSPTILNEKQAFDTLTAASAAMGHTNSKPLLERFEWIQPVSHPLSATNLRSVLGLPALQHARLWCHEIDDMPTILAVIVGRKLENAEKPLCLKSLDVCCVDSTSNPLNLPVPNSNKAGSTSRLSHDEQVTLAWTAAAARLNTLISLTLRNASLTASALLNLSQPNTTVDPKIASTGSGSSNSSGGRGGGVTLQSLRLVRARFSLGVLPTLLIPQRFPSLTSLEFVRDQCNDLLFSRALMKSALIHPKLRRLALIRCPSLIIDEEFAQAIHSNTSLEEIQIVPARCAIQVGGACRIDVTSSSHEEVEVAEEDDSNESILTPVSERRSSQWTVSPSSSQPHPALNCCHRCRTDYQLLKQAALNNNKLQVYFRYQIV